ncbi:MFS transporter [Nocardioides sp. Bht2]|uniref:MFS transporter n=1 Tax=Nocardioides sp. Bht2 TaxID=3392297 RepID=UPI0039B42502
MRAENRTITALCSVELFALTALVVPISVGLAIRVPEVTGLTREVALSAVVVPGAITAMLANPLFGWLGDRSKRRPLWALGGVCAGAGAGAGLAFAPNLLLLAIAWCAMQAAYNATFAALYGTMADLLTDEQRATVSGWFAAAASGAVMLGMAAVMVLPRSTFVLLVLFPLLTVVVTLPAVRHLLTVPVPSVPERALQVGLLGGLLRAPAAYWWVWLQRLVTQAGYGLITLYGLYYLQRRTGLDQTAAGTWVAASSFAASALAVAAAIWVGRVGIQRAGIRRVMFASLALLACALVVKAVGTAPAMYTVAAMIAGLGIGAYSALDLTLVLKAVDGPQAGTLLGFFNIARTLPQSLVPFAAPAVLALGAGDPLGPPSSQNYLALNLIGVALVVVAAALVRPIGARLLDPAPEREVVPGDLTGSR